MQVAKDNEGKRFWVSMRLVRAITRGMTLPLNAEERNRVIDFSWQFEKHCDDNTTLEWCLDGEAPVSRKICEVMGPPHTRECIPMYYKLVPTTMWVSQNREPEDDNYRPAKECGNCTHISYWRESDCGTGADRSVTKCSIRGHKEVNPRWVCDKYKGCNCNVVTDVPKPKYKHDCDKCIYLGAYCGYDMYECGTSIVLRYSSEPSDNISYMLGESVPSDVLEAVRKHKSKRKEK